MKILITGSTGFLGSHIMKALIKDGHEVIILKRSFSEIWRISDVLPKVTVYNLDECTIEQPFKECGPINTIIHTATKYDRNGERPSQLLDSNVAFPLKLLETAILFKTEKFINTDSFIHKNGQQYNHLAGYALTKKQFLDWGKKLTAAKNIHFMNVRLEHVYGSFDGEDKFNSFVIRSCLKNIPELDLTKGEQKRDFIHIDDIISAYSLLLKLEGDQIPWFQEYELGTGRSVTIRHFVELIHKKSKSNTVLKFGAIPYRQNEIMDSKANIEVLQKLGWSSNINLDKGIEQILKDEKSRLGLC